MPGLRAYLGYSVVPVSAFISSATRLASRHTRSKLPPQIFADLLFRVASAHQLDGNVESLARVVEAGDASTTVEVGADTDVVDTDES